MTEDLQRDGSVLIAVTYLDQITSVSLGRDSTHEPGSDGVSTALMPKALGGILVLVFSAIKFECK
jgi:hypothetical protein